MLPARGVAAAIVLGAALFQHLMPARAANYSWTGDAVSRGGSNDWFAEYQVSSGSYVNNWGLSGNPPLFPASGDNVTIGPAASTAVNQNITLGSLTIGSAGSVSLGGNLTYTIVNSLVDNGTITLDPTTGSWANRTTLTFSGNQTLSGTGSICCTGGGCQVSNSSGTLTQAAGHTICGFGLLNAAFLNDGLVNANSSGQGLTVQTSAMTNNSTMEATAGGVLNVTTSINNASGLLLASGGNITTNGATITGGTLTSTGSSYIEADSAATLAGVLLSGSSTFNAGTGVNLNQVALGAATQYTLFANTTTTVSGGLVNNGTITLDPTTGSWANRTTLSFSGNQTLSGTGSICCMGGGCQVSASSGTLTQAAGHTICGFGLLNAAFLNDGLVNANSSGQGLTVQTSAMTNNSTMEATAGGVLNITTSINNASGLLLASGGNITTNGATITGGTLTSTGSSYIEADSATTLAGVLLSGSSTFNAGAGVNLNQVALGAATQYTLFANTTTTVSGGLVNNGTITLDPTTGSSANRTTLSFSGNQTLSGTGSIYCTGGGCQVSASSGTLTQAAGHAICGFGMLNAPFVNYGLVNANSSGQTLNLQTSAMTNNGTMEATAGGVLNITTSIDNTNGVMLASGGNIASNGGTITGGTFASAGAGYLSNNGYAYLSGVTLAAGAQYIESTGYSTTVSGGLVNNGTITLNYAGAAPLTFSGNQTLSGTGSIVLAGGGGQVNSSGGTLTQAAGHTIYGYGQVNAALINYGVINANSSGQTLTLQTNAMANRGTMETSGGGLLNINTAIDNTNGVILANGGDITINGATITGGTLTSIGASYFQAWGTTTLSGVLLSGSSTFYANNNDRVSLNQVALAAGTQYIQSNSYGTTVSGGLVNNGTITLNYAGAAPFTFSGNQTLSGTGSIVLAGGGNGQVSSSGGTLTQAAGHTIFGYGQVECRLDQLRRHQRQLQRPDAHAPDQCHGQQGNHGDQRRRPAKYQHGNRQHQQCDFGQRRRHHDQRRHDHRRHAHEHRRFILPSLGHDDPQRGSPFRQLHILRQQ